VIHHPADKEGKVVTLLDSNSADAPKRLFDPRNFQRPFLILWAIFSIFYFSELAGFSLSIDEESAVFRSDAAVWVAQDRWLAYLIERFLLPPPILPFFPLFLFGALASLSYMIVVRVHQYRLEEWPVLLAFILFSAFPVLYFVLDFSVVTISFGVALLLSCVCLFLFDRAMDSFSARAAHRGGTIGLFALQALSAAAVIGVYQSLILLVAAGCCGIFLLRYLRGPAMSLRQILTAHLYLACSLVASVILAFLISRGFQWLLGVQPGYIGGFIRPEQLLDTPFVVIQKLAKEYWQIYGGKRAVYGLRYITFPALLLLGMFALAARAQRGTKAIFFVILYMAAMTAIPFAINLISGGKLPYRTLVAVPYVFWFFAAGAVLSHITVVRRLAVALVIIVSIQCLYTFSTFQAQKRLVLDHDRLLASEIYQRIVAQIPDFDRSKIYVVDLYGAHEFRSIYKEINGSTLSASFFEWDDGNPRRIVDFMKILGYSNFVQADPTVRKALLPVMQEMPVWPAAGSVRIADGVILVRLGERPGVVHKRAMTAAEEP
jgi:hypothetical protein